MKLPNLNGRSSATYGPDQAVTWISGYHRPRTVDVVIDLFAPCHAMQDTSASTASTSTCCLGNVLLRPIRLVKDCGISFAYPMRVNVWYLIVGLDIVPGVTAGQRLHLWVIRDFQFQLTVSSLYVFMNSSQCFTTDPTHGVPAA